MAWLAVDKNGDEYLFENRPIRKEIFAFSEPTKWFPKDLWDDSFVELPKGTIKKLIGRQLTWNNAPVELKI